MDCKAAPWLLAGLALASLATGCAAQSPPEDAPPNVVILVADDLGWKDVSFHGAEFATPHIDRIAQEGAELARFYAMPVCTPARVALLTGRLPIRYGLQRVTIKAWTDLGIPPEVETLPELLAKAGYTRRGAFGKWHLGDAKRFHPYEQGFTDFVGHYSGAIDYYRHTTMDVLDWHHGYALSTEEGYSTDLIGNHAERFVRDADPGEPFFLYVPFNAIHSPHQATEEHLERHSAVEPENRRVKAAMTTSMDDAVGRILDALDERGIADDTLVLFFSDNGGVPSAGSSNEPLRGRKHTVYEGGIRVAAAARWPNGGIAGGGRIDAPLSVLDLLPTLAGIAGLPDGSVPEGDGGDVLPILRGDMAERSDFRMLHYFNGRNIPGNGGHTPDAERLERAAVVTEEWKLIRAGPNMDGVPDPREGATLELFRILDDPNETQDVAESNPEVVESLLAEIVRFRQLKPPDALPMPLERPEGWSQPATWEITP